MGGGKKNSAFVVVVVTLMLLLVHVSSKKMYLSRHSVDHLNTRRTRKYHRER